MFSVVSFERTILACLANVPESQPRLLRGRPLGKLLTHGCVPCKGSSWFRMSASRPFSSPSHDHLKTQLRSHHFATGLNFGQYFRSYILGSLSAYLRRKDIQHLRRVGSLNI